MEQSWKNFRKEKRVAVRVPVVMEVIGTKGQPGVLESFVEDISGHGFRLSLAGKQPTPVHLSAGERYQIWISFSRNKLRGIIEVVWKNDDFCGVRFLEREKGWLVNT